MARYLLFFGAGASKPFGIPTMEEFSDRLKLDGEEARLLQEIKGSLTKFNIRTDLESIFTALNEYKLAFDPSLLSPALAVRLHEALYGMTSKNFGSERLGDIEALRQNIQRQIVEICRVSGKGTQIYETFEKFLSSAVPTKYESIFTDSREQPSAFLHYEL